MTEDASAQYKRRRFPAEVIAHVLWLYCRFPPSLRDVEDLLAPAQKRPIAAIITICDNTAHRRRTKTLTILILAK